MPDDGLTREVTPEGLRLSVVHHQRRVVELARGPEVEHPVAQPAVVGDRRVAQRAVRHGDRDAVERVVHDLVPDQHLHRIGAGFVTNGQRENGLVVVDEVDVIRGEELWFVDRRDAVGRRATGPDRRQIDQRVGEVRIRRVVECGEDVLVRR